MLHQAHVRGLFGHIHIAHDYGALHRELGAGGGRRYAVLPGAGGGDHAPPAHALGEHGLSDGVVDFVGSAVVEILSLDVYIGAFSPAVLVVVGESLREI